MGKHHAYEVLSNFDGMKDITELRAIELERVLANLSSSSYCSMPSATYTGPSNVISARSVDAVRPLKVICLGAGVSGILAAIRFPERVKNLDLVIYEKNEEIGGTWFENKYPGCACGRQISTF